VTRPRVAVVPGDGAAPEVVAPAVEVADAAGADVEWVTVDGADLDAATATIDSVTATLFGAAGQRAKPLLLHLRWGCETFANVRPIRYLPGARSPLRHPEGIDFVIVRENLEDLYAGVEGELAELAPLHRRDRGGRPLATQSGTYAVKVVTGERTAAVARTAFTLARDRAGQVTVGVKDNVLPRTDGLFREVVSSVATEYPDITVRFALADDLGQRMVARPHDLDVVLLPNLYGDLLSDVAAALVGGLGMAPSGCYGRSYAYFEAVHGTAPDIAGRGIINPTAQFLSTAMLLSHVGRQEAADRLTRAVADVYAEARELTPDQGGTATTRQFTSAVLRRLVTS
jgi:isocitrate/isopropylmalate dehydrogenase